VEDWSQPPAVGIMGEDLAPVFHQGGGGERLSSGARAEVEHLRTGLGPGKLYRDLRALILHLEPTLGKGRFRLDMRMTAIALHRRNTKSARGDGARHGVHM